MKKSIIMFIMVILTNLASCATTKTNDVEKAMSNTKPQQMEENKMGTSKRINTGNEEITIFINAGDHKIPAIVTIPKEASINNKVPAVIMLHATGADKNGAGDGFKDIAPQFAAAGIACIRIDFMGSGESTEDYAKYSFSTALIDIDVTVDYLLSLGIIDSKRLGVLGWSQGGTDALLAAARNDTFVSVMTWAGSINLGHLLVDDQMRVDAQKQGYAILNFSFGGSAHLGKQWIDEVDSTNVLEKVSEIKAPIYAIAGTKDTVVPPQAATDIINASKNKDSKKYIIENADHIFNLYSGDRTTYEVLCKETINWFKKTL